MIPRIRFSGPAKYRFQGLTGFSRALRDTSLRRALNGPRYPHWSWFLEVATQVLKQRMAAVFLAGDVNESRRYLDSIQIDFPETAEVSTSPVVESGIKGKWFAGKDADDITLLYFHGGGYSFYPEAYANFIALIALATKARTFALDYSLAPEHRFPTQLQEGIAAYKWLLKQGIDPEKLVIAGDSAGGNLTLAVLLAVRDSQLPQPALAIALSPPTDFESEYLSMTANSDSDWITREMLVKWADWFCDAGERRNPLVSPLWGNLQGLPTIYLQAGTGEILYDGIRAFADRAKRAGANVVLEAWDNMNHDFQIFGRYASQSAEALRRMGEVVDAVVRKRKKILPF